MRNPLMKRLDKMQGILDMAEISPLKVQDALHDYEERGVLPAPPRLRAMVEKISAFLVALDIATTGEPAPKRTP